MSGRFSLLIVEDSPTQAERLSHVLAEAHPSTDIRIAKNGSEALQSIQMRRPDLIISDIVMPVMDGYEMSAAIKQDPQSRDIPIILLTSLSDPVDIIRGLNAGADYYLTKPYEEEFLKRKVTTILENPGGPKTNGDAVWTVNFAGENHVVHADLQQMLNLLLSTYENAVQQNRKLLSLQDELRRVNERLEERVKDRTKELSQTNEQLRIEVGERRRAESQLQLQLKRVDALRNVDSAITSSLDLRVTLNVLLDQVTSQLEVDAAAVLLLKPSSVRLEPAARRGFRSRLRELNAHDFSKGPAGRAARERVLIRVDRLELAGETPLPAACLREEAFRAYAAVPLIAKGCVEGVLEVYSRASLNDDDEWHAFLEALAGHAAIAIDSALLFENLQRSNADLLDAYEMTLEGWSKALDLRDKETEGHSIRVTEMTLLLGRKMGVSDTELLHMRRGALLHDIGKLGVTDTILRKPGPLSDTERKLMEQHPVYAKDWLSTIAFLEPALDIPYSHHEKWDGTGYPLGLRGKQIPLAARIFALVDVWDALRSDRPYRAAWGRKRCCEHITSLKGAHFAPDVVEAFVELYQELGADIDPLPDDEARSGVSIE